MKTIINKQKLTALLVAAMTCFSGCDYLDIVPDNIATIEFAFRNRNEAQKYLFGCFSYLPPVGDGYQNPALMGGDEIWVPIEFPYGANVPREFTRLVQIAMGTQGTENPICDFWHNLNLWRGISDINIFLQNVDKPFDLLPTERDRWTGEAIFFKAYYHYFLFRAYGPIPLIKENYDVSIETDQMQRYREPVYEVADYIAELCDRAAELLPETIADEALEMGRPTKCMALAVKAQALTLAASPLFNCNPDYADFKDARGVQLFPQDKALESGRWQMAAAACKEAIDAAHEAGHALYDFPKYYPGAANLSAETVLAMQVRGAATDRWNKEIIWGSTNTINNEALQKLCMPYLIDADKVFASGLNTYAPTLQAVEQFYTKNGIPIEEDAEWVGKDPMGLRTATAAERQYIKQGAQTCNLHFDREARFYGAIQFDNGTFFGNTRITQDNTTNANYLWVTNFDMSGLAGAWDPFRYSMTGYLCKKLININTSTPATSSGFTNYPYSFPIIRLADLYLLYSEALNETLDAPTAEVYEYIDLVRARTGLNGVVKSWNDAGATADIRSKPLSKEGMRSIIRRERLNELAFEGPRFWDLRRWKLASDYMNKPIRGLSIKERGAAFYNVQTVYQPVFTLKNYLWPIRTADLLKNRHLVQNPAW